MYKKFRFIIIIFIILLFSLVFFFNKSEKTKDEIVFWTLQLGTFDKYINDVISEFEKENPNIKIKWVDVPYSEGEKRTLAALLSDNPPDLINLTPDFSVMAAQRNTLFEIPKDAMSAFSESLYPSLSYNGKFFAIPFYLTSAITFANKDLMEKAEIKKIPQNYEEMFAIAPKIKNKTNCYVEMPALTENDTFLKILNKYKIDIFSELNSEKSLKIFEMYKTAYENNFIPKESITQNHREALEKYMAGEVVFLQAGANFLNIVKENAPTVYKNTILANQLTGPTGKYDFSLMNLIIPKKSKNTDSALKFAIFLTNEKNQLEFAKLTSVLPANKYTLNNEYFKNKDTKEDIAKSISASQISNVASNTKNSRHKKNIITLINNTLSEILTDKIEIKKGLNELDIKIKDYEE